MAQRPERKRSALGAAHPIDHQNSQPQAATNNGPVSDAVGQDAGRSGMGEVGTLKDTEAPQRTLEAIRRPSNKGKALPKGSFYAEEAELERIRAAWFHTPTTAAEREASFSDFLREAALDRMMKREKTYNDGKPFPVVRSGKIARGRR